MTPARELRQDQIIYVSGPPGGSFGRVLQASTPEELPQIKGAPSPETVRAILAEGRITQLALIGWFHNGAPVMCVVFGDGEGNWHDLKNQSLTVHALTKKETQIVEAGGRIPNL